MLLWCYSCIHEETSHTTRTAAKQKIASGDPPCVKRQYVTTTHGELYSEGNTRCKSDNEDNVEVDGTPLTKANIPKIVDTILSNFSMEGTSSRDDSQDNPHLSEKLVSFMCVVVVMSC